MNYFINSIEDESILSGNVASGMTEQFCGSIIILPNEHFPCVFVLKIAYTSPQYSIVRKMISPFGKVPICNGKY